MHKLIHALVCILILSLSQPMFAAAGGFVGAVTCGDCHDKQFESWRGSHHDLAMQHASEETMLGDFDDAGFTYNGVTTRFFRRDGKFFVNTDSADGTLQDFEIRYTFGVDPLQQYLVEFPDGRLQALSVSWDTRPAKDGGQRWFHLYPGENVTHMDEIHWTGPQQNWNYMCADCHSTRLEKDYSVARDAYTTSWSEINVACEACHGPGEQHAAWAGGELELNEEDVSKGHAFLLDDRKGVSWTIDPTSGNAARSQPNKGKKEIEVCATCHSRRGIIEEGASSEASFLDHYMPALLTEGLYHADGQVQDEVYVWGSFQQSKMHAAGVTCSDCHDPHSQKLKAPGDAVCAQCHLPAKFAVISHHHHPAESDGARCANCHMPETTYMVVDPRRDHSLRIPRPDLSVTFGTPNACNQCHTGQDAGWAAEQVRGWFPEPKAGHQVWTEAFSKARAGVADAGPLLAALVTNPEVPDIARATALIELQYYLDPVTAPALQAAFSDESPLVRIAALRTSTVLPMQNRAPFAAQLLVDDVLAVRVEAARLLAGSRLQVAGGGRDPLADAIREYIGWQNQNADRPESHVNLGNLYVALNDPGIAETSYRQAIKVNSRFTPAYVNLSDTYRGMGMENEAANVLREGLQANPDDATIHHSLGLLEVRRKNLDVALASLKKAHELAPESTRFAYVYGVALSSTGKGAEAIEVLESAHQGAPGDGTVLFALATLNRDQGLIGEATRWAEKLALISPDEPSVQQLLQSLQSD